MPLRFRCTSRTAAPARLGSRLAGLVVGLLAVLGLGGGGGRAAAQTLPTGSLAHGPFEIVVTARRISTGAFPNTSGNPFATREVSDFALRFKGQPVRAAGGGDGRWWRILRLDGAARPAVLLVTTGFVLATEEPDGSLKLQPLTTQSSSLAEAQWLDAVNGQPGPELRFGIEAVADLQAGTRLGGGRWLRLGSRSILDLATLKVHAVDPWVPIVPGVPITSISREGDRVRAFSPGRSHYVLAASGPDYSLPDRPTLHGLLVVEIATGIAAEMRLDRRRFRFAEADDVDAAWIEHHLVWQRTPQGQDRLVPRERFTPWPWRARLSRPSGTWQLDVPRIDRAFLAVVQRLVEAEPGAQVRDTSASWGPGFEVTVGSCRLEARAFGSDNSAVEDRRIGIWPSAGNAAASAACEPLLRQLATRIDAELATGRHDGLLTLR